MLRVYIYIYITRGTLQRSGESSQGHTPPSSLAFCCSKAYYTYSIVCMGFTCTWDRERERGREARGLMTVITRRPNEHVHGKPRSKSQLSESSIHYWRTSNECIDDAKFEILYAGDFTVYSVTKVERRVTWEACGCSVFKHSFVGNTKSQSNELYYW